MQSDVPSHKDFTDIESLLQSGRLSEAAEALEKQIAVKATPENCLLLGRTYLELSLPQKAFEAFDKARSFAPFAAQALAGQALALQKTGQYPEARILAEQALELDPGLPEAHKNLGLVLLRTGDADAGEKAILTAMELDPGFAEAMIALAYLRLTQKRIPEAEQLLLQARELQPASAAAASNLGMIYRRQDRLEEALAVLEEVADRRPDSPEIFNNLALVHKDARRFGLAEEYFRKAMGLAPKNANFSMNLVSLLKEHERYAEAAELAMATYEQHPGNPHILGTLPFLLLKADRREEALQMEQQMVELMPDFPGGHYNQALTLMHMEKFAEAEKCARRAIELDPKFVDGHVCLAQILMKQDRPEEALEQGRIANELEPSAASHFVMAMALKDLKRMDEAVAQFRECVRLDPHEKLGAGVFLAALTGEDAAPESSQAYVRNLFDQYAERYDAHLVNKLDYQGPQVIKSLLEEWLSRSEGLRILDLGCGTGLCGPVLRQFADELVGVDLSGKMVTKAKSLEVYDRLEEAEAHAFLEQEKGVYDCIAAADVLVYVGPLERLFGEARRVLADGGLFVLTLEKNHEPGVNLGLNGRYAHSEDYVRDVSEEHGFAVLAVRDVQVRREMKQPVPSLAVALRAV